MKFLAILRDSLRETLDSKVFYVMVGASVLLMLVSATITVKPEGTADEYLSLCTVSLNVDLKEAALAYQEPQRILKVLLDRAGRDQYRVLKVGTTEGEPNKPSSHYQALIAGKFRNAQAAEEVRANPEKALALLKEQFGNLLGARMVEVTDVRLGSSTAIDQSEVAFVVDTAPTPVTYRLWPHRISLFFGAMPLPFLDGAPLGAQLYLLEGFLVNGLGGWVAILVSIIITAGFVPNMLRKGTLDLLLAKPIRRPTLLLYKYVGGLTFIFLNTTLAVGGVWLMVGLRTGIWSNGFLLSIPVLTFFFAILYAASTLFGLLTRSPVSAILLTCAVWFFLFLVGTVFQFAELFASDQGRKAWHEAMQRGRPPELREKYKDDGLTPEQRRAEESWFFKAGRRLHAILPRTSDLGQLTDRALQRDLLFANQLSGTTLDPTPVNWRESLLVSLAFIAVMLGLACWRFSVKDY